jgi:hypothetical protein
MNDAVHPSPDAVERTARMFELAELRLWRARLLRTMRRRAAQTVAIEIGRNPYAPGNEHMLPLELDALREFERIHIRRG